MIYYNKIEIIILIKKPFIYGAALIFELLFVDQNFLCKYQILVGSGFNFVRQQKLENFTKCRSLLTCPCLPKYKQILHKSRYEKHYSCQLVICC